MKNAIWLFSFAVIVLIVFLPSYTTMQDLREKNFEYNQQINRLTQENRKLTEEKRRLEEDPVYLEKVAREKMGLAREGEVVYKIVPEQINKEE
jgi:cell division protein FtsB